MSQTSQFFIRHGLPLVFVAVLVEQVGLPLPALPWLLAAGALSATGQFSFPIGVAVTVLACLIADASWFYLGRHWGNRVLGVLCRISLEPDSCVRRTQNLFTRYGLWGLLAAKFLPGLETVAPPLAGMSGMSASQFLSVDAAGSLLYGGCFLGLGYLFSRQIEQIGGVITRIGRSALALPVGLAALYIAYKYWQRRRLLHELRTARITADELRNKLDAGENPVILDLRSSTELAHEDKVFQGALVASMSIPWGETKGDNDLGGYHLVWTRDLVQSATALLATGQTATPLRALIWLAALQRPDGGFPQNSWIDGSACWCGLQLDEVAAPILLAWRLHQHSTTREQFDSHRMIMRAAACLILQGPVTSQERWEENAGYSPSTLATVIAGLICAAACGKERGQTGLADFILVYTDWLAAHLEEWTVTTRGELIEGFPRHYIRINPTDRVRRTLTPTRIRP